MSDPRAPYHRKQAFDVGDVGFGITANQLSLGCDCLGHIKYFDGFRTDSKGEPIQLKNVICLHEQDNGLQHKHTNYRSGAATVVRNRQLVVQMICTVANYEYIFAFIFDQAANIELEVRATGILSTVPFENADGQTVPWGTNVGPGVMAPYHQHMFSLRIDPALDGYKNTVYYEDSVAMPEDDLNPYMVGYTTEKNVIKRSGSAWTSVDKNRVFKICNDNIINPITHHPIAYKLQTSPSQMMLAHPKSFALKRAQFATRPIWVTKYQDDELFAAGEFTNQSKKSEGVEVWAARNDNVENEDLVLWHSKLPPAPTLVCFTTLTYNSCSIRSYSQPPCRGFPSDACRACQRYAQAGRFLHQESGPGCAAVVAVVQQVHATPGTIVLLWASGTQPGEAVIWGGSLLI